MPIAGLALPRARALPPQGSSLPRARFISALGPATESPVHCTSTRSSQCPVGLYLPALFARDPNSHAHTHARAHEHGHAHKHTRTSNWKRSTQCTLAHWHSDGEGHSRLRRWVRRHGEHGSSGDQRRKHPSDDHRPAANAKQRQKQKQKRNQKRSSP
jgi:hypothetical protein